VGDDGALHSPERLCSTAMYKRFTWILDAIRDGGDAIMMNTVTVVHSIENYEI
jgi:hypothetical protein